MLTKAELQESEPLKRVVAEFFQDTYPEFEHIQPKHLLCLATTNIREPKNPHTRHIEILMPNFETVHALPDIYYIITAYPPFGDLPEEEQKKKLHHIFSHIPRDYTTNHRLLYHDIEEFRETIKKFTEKSLRQLL